MLKSAVAMQLESRFFMLEDIGRQVQVLGKIQPLSSVDVGH